MDAFYVLRLIRRDLQEDLVDLFACSVYPKHIFKIYI